MPQPARGGSADPACAYGGAHVPDALGTAIRFVAVVAISGLLAFLSWPWLKNAIYVSRLLTEDVPVSLPMPVRGVAPRALRDTFGAPRPGDRRHEGIDIFAARGTPVVATTHGIVTRIGENRLGGTVVWVLGPGGDRHYYAHLDSVANIRAGQRVTVGDVLGSVGNTGNARGTPPHLHYGIYRRGISAINPYALLTVRPAGSGSAAGQTRRDTPTAANAE